MNIFTVNLDPIKAAQELCNRHIVKMPTETCNLLLWPFQMLGTQLPATKSNNIIKLSHFNHPCSIFTRTSRENYNWVLAHAKALNAEYAARYKQSHFCENYINWIENNLNKLDTFNFAFKGLGRFPRCFGQALTPIDTDNLATTEAYHKFYWLDKNPFARWPSVDKIPSWWYGGKNQKWVDSSFINGLYAKR